ncbi:glutaredoxin family protein [Allohahella sp. A8]|uniref:glutaredoxin family protein n=1 Tax=Allohahella sp. A8 TaxID=3141461 RepID=UPI000C0A98F7|nr:NrdH-redoxin [Hahellaceae bacterium]|tara:strand:- start:6939 stop:7319 length:381 start_codon:yes stop_codon:yes gene_type:complete
METKNKVIMALVCLIIALNWERLVEDGRKLQAAQSNSPEVMLYSTAWCGYCDETRAILRENKTAFTEFDIEESDEAMTRFQALGGRGVPLLIIGNETIEGFDEPRLLKLIAASSNGGTQRPGSAAK